MYQDEFGEYYVLRYDAFNRLSLYGKYNLRFVNFNTLKKIEFGYTRFLIILSKSRKMNEIVKFVKELFLYTENQYFLITYPSLAIRHILGLDIVCSVEINFDSFYDEDSDQESIATSKREKEYLKYATASIKSDSVFRCEIEISDDMETYSSKKYTGNLDGCVKFVYDYLMEHPKKEELFNSIYVDTHTEKLELGFKNKFLMYVADKKNDLLYNINYLVPPVFHQDIEYLFNVDYRDAVITGGFRIIQLYRIDNLMFPGNLGVSLDTIPDEHFLTEIIGKRDYIVHKPKKRINGTESLFSSEDSN